MGPGGTGTTQSSAQPVYVRHIIRRFLFSADSPADEAGQGA